MFVLISKITITQVNNAPYTGRNKSFILHEVADCEIDSTWAHLTDTAKITLPRKIFFKDNTGRKISWAANTDIYGNPDKTPLVMRGDKINIQLGYAYFTSSGIRQMVTTFNNEFTGYVTRIENKTPVVLHCEDNMYLLKQTKVDNKVWSNSTYSIETMLKEMIKSHPEISVNVDNYKHKTGDYISRGQTVAQVLDEIRKNYHLESYIRPKGTPIGDGAGNFAGYSQKDELRCGIIRYYPEDRINHILHFQKNVASNTLDYTRDNDVRIGIKAISINKKELTTVNGSGKPKTRHQRLEVNVGDQDGEIRTLFFPEIDNLQELTDQANAALPYLKYEGFHGGISAFGLPFIKHGDSVQLINSIIPEQKGTYLVKQTKVRFGMGGYRRDCFLDIRIDGLSATQLSKFQNFGL